MSLPLPNQTNLGTIISSRSDAVKFKHGPLEPVQISGTNILLCDGSGERIKKMFGKVDLSVSSYDTAWMAMVPSSVNPQTTPQFPSCLNWVLNNQRSDGSWGICDRDATLTMDALSSTLACVLALKQWGTGERQIDMGLEFIAANSASVNDSKQRKLIGFDIIFPGMIERAKSLNLNIPVRQADLDTLLNRRKIERARSSEGRNAYLTYISEGMGISQDWEMAMKYQRNNGSLFDSPSATAAAFSHIHDANCLRYLNLLVDRFGDAVPAAVYPLDIYTRLCMVDNLESLGIHHHFQEEIATVLEETYRSWLQGEEEIFYDTTTCAKAFRILRLHGYDVSSDALSKFCNESHFRDTLEGYLAETDPVLELYKASEIVIHENDAILEEINSWTKNWLKHAREGPLDKHLRKEVDNALMSPYQADLEWAANRRNIENYNSSDNIRIFKSAVRYTTIGNKDFLNLAVENFNKRQVIIQEEMKDLERWVVEKRLDTLKFARQRHVYCYLSAAASLTTPELSDARNSWAKNAVMATITDDFFDVSGSEEELEKLIQLISKYGDVDLATECCSEELKIIYSALYSTICELDDKAYAWQGRRVTRHITETWLELLEAYLTEAKWRRRNFAPTLREYMTNGAISFTLGPLVVLTLYCVGPLLSENAVQSSQLRKLFLLTGLCGRLSNDVQCFKRELEDEGKLNSVTLQMMHTGCEEDEAVKMVKGLIRSTARELLRCVLEEKDSSVIPRACRDLFWKMSAVIHIFYMDQDSFTSGSLMHSMEAMFEKLPVSSMLTLIELLSAYQFDSPYTLCEDI